MFPAKGSWEIKALPLAGTHLLSDLLGSLLPVGTLPQNPAASGYLLAEPALLGIFSSQPVDEDLNGLYEYLEVHRCGGSWHYGSAYLRNIYRAGSGINPPDYTLDVLGFRCAFSASP